MTILPSLSPFSLPTHTDLALSFDIFFFCSGLFVPVFTSAL
jgi:hypothetical protein